MKKVENIYVKKYLPENRDVVPPRICLKQRYNVNEQNTTKSERKGQKIRGTTKAPFEAAAAVFIKS